MWQFLAHSQVWLEVGWFGLVVLKWYIGLEYRHTGLWDVGFWIAWK